ncbi:hypothetical protein FACS1894202_08380 [Clostridia bacterium]|nr:hypothetical protein FACS1894202_08380 [Clostridia bacterium]
MRTDNGKIICEILLRIEEQFDEKSIDWSKFNSDALNMSLPRWIRLMEMLDDGGVIRGFAYSGNADKPNIEIKNLGLTFKGLEMAERAKKGYLRFEKP